MRCSHHQAGIGTYVVSNSLSHTGTVARIKSWYMKAKDSAIGSSFDQHVVGGYRFLMRFYNPGDEIYIFGFSRGAYIARFLAEMLDYVGLLSHGNEEMVVFAWKAFSNWQSRQGNKTPEGIKKMKEMYAFMRGFRETFSRPVRRIRFLGLFDTVNSVPRFETAWMQRSKFPYTARTSAKVVRHAVSIDERRAKFRQDLIYQSDRGQKPKEGSPAKQKLHKMDEKYRKKAAAAPRKSTEGKHRGRRGTLDVPDDPAPYRARSHSTRRSRMTDASVHDDDGKSEASVAPHPHDEDHDVNSIAESEDENDQDIDEVWFAGGHADIGGGWEMLPESKAASHVPLVWMVHEAMKAGLHFDLDKVRELGCAEALDEACMTSANQNQEASNPPPPPGTDANDAAEHPPIPNIMVRSPSTITPKLVQQSSFNDTSNANATSSSSSSSSGSSNNSPPTFHEMMHRAHTALIHDSLEFGGGLGWSSVLAWKIMECVHSPSHFSLPVPPPPLSLPPSPFLTPKSPQPLLPPSTNPLKIPPLPAHGPRGRRLLAPDPLAFTVRRGARHPAQRARPRQRDPPHAARQDLPPGQPDRRRRRARREARARGVRHRDVGVRGARGVSDRGGLGEGWWWWCARGN